MLATIWGGCQEKTWRKAKHCQISVPGEQRKLVCDVHRGLKSERNKHWYFDANRYILCVVRGEEMALSQILGSFYKLPKSDPYAVYWLRNAVYLIQCCFITANIVFQKKWREKVQTAIQTMGGEKVLKPLYFGIGCDLIRHRLLGARTLEMFRYDWPSLVKIESS